jgi:competence transcription factor ComK
MVFWWFGVMVYRMGPITGALANIIWSAIGSNVGVYIKSEAVHGYNPFKIMDRVGRSCKTVAYTYLSEYSNKPTIIVGFFMPGNQQ